MREAEELFDVIANMAQFVRSARFNTKLLLIQRVLTKDSRPFVNTEALLSLLLP